VTDEDFSYFVVINLFHGILYNKLLSMKLLKEEFLEILTNYQGILHKVNLIYFRNKTDREDNFQEIIYQLWKSFPTLQNRSSIGSWIYAVSINTSISRLKKESRIEYREKLPELIDKIDLAEELSINNSLQLLLKAIYNLHETDKSIMLLYLEEKSYDEIAEIIGISKSNVGVRINRAKENLKQTLKHLNYGN
jgi:RNA polymerase sigma-70 factor, ECF subfamily